MPSDNWIDDERDTSHPISYERSVKSRDDEDVKPVSTILKEYYQEQQNEQYTWTKSDHKKEVEKRRAKALVPRPPRPIVNDVKPEDDEEENEVNDELLEKAIYRKCWYS